MLLLNIFETTLPLTNPVLKFLIILVIILITPILLNKIKIPALLGLIIAGAFIGPNGVNLILRDDGIILSGTAGLLYIMFLAGLEIDLVDFKKNSKKSLIFGLFTFSIPMIIGIFVGIYVLNFSVITSVLLASMFASHTLIAYPIISKLGVTKNKAVTVAIGGTMITDILALLVLAVIVGMTSGEVNTAFWLRLTVSVVSFGFFVIFFFPIITRWFFKKVEDNISQYIFVLAMVFFGAFLAELAGIEAIIGAFLAGLSLNRLIPRTSALMNRVEFVGNAIFIPFFLIGVGMLIDYKMFFKDFETIKVGAIMIIVATFAKFMAAWLTQKTFNFTKDERRLIFGLSNAQAAATLAAVLIGYNIILGKNEFGEPIRLLNESVLNGSILMILFTCTIASFVAQKGATNIALLENSDTKEETTIKEKILIPISNVETTDELINLGITIKTKKNKDGLYALTVVNNSTTDTNAHKSAHKILSNATKIASASDNHLQELLRYDVDISNGILNVVKEHKITYLILGLHQKSELSDSFLGDLTEGVLSKCNTTTFIYKSKQPLATVKRHLIIMPPRAEKEIGFPFWLIKIWNIAKNTGTKLVFYGTSETLNYIFEINKNHPVACEFKEFEKWDDFEIISKQIQKDDAIIVVVSKREQQLKNHLSQLNSDLNKSFKTNSFILIYPLQIYNSISNQIDLKNPSILEPIEKLDEISKTISKLFKWK
ncbi:cation:proton antiporter [Lutibacter sp.]|uniref:cation:proton antiporter n=1 Tax=Lutibacter sp. TaxID=1925666 RepID=UPI001A322BEE|nr:cation:proton antiporter [Lutibacter sp.]MBI9041028.1 cation:proton antiporter [Lutibacter sp.]